jgi:redox-sensing transcriptional repressor
VVIAGAGNLGHALADYRGFGQRGFQVAAMVDVAESKIGQKVGGLTVESIDRLADIVAREDVAIGVICTPAGAAQDVADRMVGAGIRSILNFAPAVITVPEAVSVRKVDLSIELQILAYYEQRKAVLAEVKDGRAGRGLADEDLLPAVEAR